MEIPTLPYDGEENIIGPPDLWVPDERFVSLVVSSPKVGKTLCIAALVNAGYRVVLTAFDPGHTILRNSIHPDKMHNLIILPFEDRRGFQGIGSKMTVAHRGDPVAFAKFVAFLDDGKARVAKVQGGGIIDLGPAEQWGRDTFLVVDNLSDMGDCAFDCYLNTIGRTRITQIRKDWGLSQKELWENLKQLTSSYYSFHLVVLAHWKVQGPREWEDEDKKNPDKTDYNNEMREREKDLIPTKMVPRSIGRVLSAELTRHFPTIIWAEIDDNGDRIFNLAPNAVRDSGVPVRPGTLPKTLPIETGLLSIFRAVTGAPQEKQ